MESIIDVGHDDKYDENIRNNLNETPIAHKKGNFLATQVWPAARVASQMIEQHAQHHWSICEFGCGPALPSLTAASIISNTKGKKLDQSKETVKSKTVSSPYVIATDLDSFALDMVKCAAEEQDIPLRTQIFDLTSKDPTKIPKADLYIMSDVFENNDIAKGAAFIAFTILKAGSKIWIFAQNDRAQRETFRKDLQALLKDDSIGWTSEFVPCKGQDNLWLYDVDECNVRYN